MTTTCSLLKKAARLSKGWGPLHSFKNIERDKKPNEM
jgi:hypothetical protein